MDSSNKVTFKFFKEQEKRFIKLNKKHKKLSEKIKLSILENKVNNTFFSTFAGAASEYYGEMNDIKQ